ncbi:MAG: hypothetical protein V2A58_03725 [Planctomycetota bacterium]
MARTRRVKGYLDGPQRREKLEFETYQYRLPFNYHNITVFRKFYHGGEFHGMELEPMTAVSPRIMVEECRAGEWFRAAKVFEVPPTAVRARFEIEIAQQRRGETLLLDDASSIVVPAGFRKTDRAPRGARNQLANARFEQVNRKTGFARGWGMVTAGTGSIGLTEGDAHTGRRAVAIQGVGGIAMWQDIKVEEGQTLCWSAWLKSSTSDPRVIWIFPKFYDARGGMVSDTAGDCIVVREKKPIVRVVVIGSACTPPGYVQVECEELASWRRKDELVDVMPVRFRINNLWGMHLRADQWMTHGKGAGRPEGEKAYERIPAALIEVYPGLASNGLKSDYYEFPQAGMSSAIFEIPPTRKVLIRGGSEMPGWSSDQAPNDGHYSFRIIRTTVVK